MCLASIIPFYGDGVKIGSEFLQTGYKSAGKIFLKELTTNAVNMGVSVSAQEAGVNPLLALLMYQTGRIGYKNLSRNGLSIDYVLHQSKVYDNQLEAIYKDSTLEALIDLKTINNTLDSNKEIKNAFKVIKENKECKEILFKNLESIDKSSAEEIEKALKNTLDEVKNTNKDVYESLIKNSSLSSIFKGVTEAEIVEGKKVVNNRVNNMIENMTEGEKSRTTYGSALVKLEDGTTEMWVSSAGKKGYVPPRIRGNDKVIKNKSLEANSINRFNDAEQTIMREANEVGAEIISIGATRDMCPACQAVAKENGIIDRVATPLKKIKK